MNRRVRRSTPRTSLLFRCLRLLRRRLCFFGGSSSLLSDPRAFPRAFRRCFFLLLGCLGRFRLLVLFPTCFLGAVRFGFFTGIAFHFSVLLVVRLGLGRALARLILGASFILIIAATFFILFRDFPCLWTRQLEHFAQDKSGRRGGRMNAL